GPQRADQRAMILVQEPPPRTKCLPASDSSHEESDNNHEEEEERLGGRKSRRLSLSADRCENQGARRLAGRDALGSEVSSERPTPKWSRSGSGEGIRCGRTPES